MPESPEPSTFEHYVLGLMRRLYPRHIWNHRGSEHDGGLAFLGRLSNAPSGRVETIGVGVKLLGPHCTPSEQDWLKFLADCFTLRVDRAVFVTPGTLSGEQGEEAMQAGVVPIVGRDEIARIAAQCGYPRFDYELVTKPVPAPAKRARGPLLH